MESRDLIIQEDTKLQLLLCGHPTGHIMCLAHPYVYPSICLSHAGSKLKRRVIKKKQKLVRFPGAGVTSVPNFISKGQRSRSCENDDTIQLLLSVSWQQHLANVN